MFTFAAVSDNPWATFRNNPPTFPRLTRPSSPLDTSLNRPMGFPRKSTEAKIKGA